MPASTNERRDEVLRISQRFDDRLRLARASELALCGRLLEAEALLCSGNLPMSDDELDLLARIHVKQGQFDLARRRWGAVTENGTRHVESEECVKVLDQWLDYRYRLLLWRARIAIWGLILLITVWLLIRIAFPSGT
jgi:hypothetical protein